ELAHETATFVATPELPVRAIEVRLLPPEGSDRASPRDVIVATPERLVRIDVPDAPIGKAGVTVRAPLATPFASRCGAVVALPAGRGGAPPARLAEIVARTALDEVTLEQAARGLGGADGAAR